MSLVVILPSSVVLAQQRWTQHEVTTTRSPSTQSPGLIYDYCSNRVISQELYPRRASQHVTCRRWRLSKRGPLVVSHGVAAPHVLYSVCLLVFQCALWPYIIIFILCVIKQAIPSQRIAKPHISNWIVCCTHDLHSDLLWLSFLAFLAVVRCLPVENGL